MALALIPFDYRKQIIEHCSLPDAFNLMFLNDIILT